MCDRAARIGGAIRDGDQADLGGEWPQQSPRSAPPAGRGARAPPRCGSSVHRPRRRQLRGRGGLPRTVADRARRTATVRDGRSSVERKAVAGDDDRRDQAARPRATASKSNSISGSPALTAAPAELSARNPAAAERDRLEPDVDQQLGAVGEAQSHGMRAFRNGDDRRVGGRAQRPTRSGRSRCRRPSSARRTPGPALPRAECSQPANGASRTTSLIGSSSSTPSIAHIGFTPVAV